MREHIILQLRDRACAKGKQRTWVSELSDEQLYELFLRLRREESAKSIARYIQQAWGVNPESTTHSVSQGILKFRRRIAHLLLPPTSESTSPPFLNTLDQIGQMEGTEGLELIKQLQLERIQRLITEEQETQIRHGSLSREIHALTALTKAVMKAKEFDLVHEGNDPVRRRRLERLKQRFANQFEGLLDNIGDDGRDKLVNALTRFGELVEQYAFEVEVGPDGKLKF